MKRLRAASIGTDGEIAIDAAHDSSFVLGLAIRANNLCYLGSFQIAAFHLIIVMLRWCYGNEADTAPDGLSVRSNLGWDSSKVLIGT